MNREKLIASLTATVARDAISFDDDRYIDWSVRNDDEISFEVGEGSDAIQIALTWDEITQLQQALTVLLLEREA